MNPDSTAVAAPRGITARPWWPIAKRVVSIGFFAFVAWLIIDQARSIEWSQVGTSLQQQTLGGLSLAILLTIATFFAYSCLDLFGRAYTGHKLRPRTAMLAAFVSYGFTMSLGSVVGGVAFRYRLYSRLGLDTATITQITVLAMFTNWLGYFFVGGLVFMLHPLPLPADWAIGSGALRVIGACSATASVGYVLACTFLRKREWSFRGHRLTLPSRNMAFAQLGLSSAIWLLTAGVVFVLLQQRIDYWTVVLVLLVAAVAGVLAHVPAGLGVLEAVFIALLSSQMPRSELLAGLLAYRAIYYLLPLAVATVTHLVLEARATGREAGG